MKRFAPAVVIPAILAVLVGAIATAALATGGLALGLLFWIGAAGAASGSAALSAN